MSIIQLTEGENILRTIHRHIITFFNDIFSIVLLIAMPIIFAIVLIVIPKEYTDSYFAGDTNVGIGFTTGSAGFADESAMSEAVGANCEVGIGAAGVATCC